MQVQTEGFEGAAAAAEQASESAREASQQFIDEYTDTALDVAQSLDDTAYCSQDITFGICRADEEIFSFTRGVSSYLGGAHGSYYISGYTYDSRTGEALTLKDITTDYDGLYAETVKQLETYEDGALYDDYEETVHSLFYDQEGPQWYLTVDGLEIVFNPYEIAPYAAGLITVKFDFEDYPALLESSYSYNWTARIRTLSEYETKVGDLNGDGAEESILVQNNYDYDAYTSTLTIAWNGEETTWDEYGEYDVSYLVTTEDGRMYLYAIYRGDNDYQILDVYDLNEDAPFLVDSIGNLSVYGGNLTNPAQMYLRTRVNLLGTYETYRAYEVGENGLPVSMDATYQIVTQEEAWNKSLTSSLDLQVWLETEDGLEEAYYPAGTVFYPRSTDGETYLEAALEDGTLCQIQVEEKDGINYINGVSEYDCFELLPYAG
jgi:hypothetical protein